MTIQHTPAPWIIDPNDDLPLAVIAAGENGEGICELSGNGRTPRMLADARLIAAAPDLLGIALRLEAIRAAFQKGTRGGAIMGELSTIMDRAAITLNLLNP